mgnify:CR=1 FL=1
MCRMCVRNCPVGAITVEEEKVVVDLTEDAVISESEFTSILEENETLAVKCLFYLGDCRGGQGERRFFRVCFRWLADNYSEAAIRNLNNVSEFGRWDDLYEFVGTPLEDEMFNLIDNQLKNDIVNCNNNKPISLLAKWLKSTSGVSVENAKLGRLTAKKLHLSYKAYRQILSKLRAYLNIVERNMSMDEWNKIVYREVPALAMKRYRNTFKEHNLIEFKEYIEKVKSGEETIKAATLYPYNIMEGAGLTDNWRSRLLTLSRWDEVLEEQWKALPNYVEGHNNIMVMADTSGSMSGRPLATSVGLATYFAERNQGPYKNKFIVLTYCQCIIMNQF